MFILMTSKCDHSRGDRSMALPDGVIARIMAICGNSAALTASAEITIKAAAIARLEKWTQWLNSVYVYQCMGVTWNRCGIGAFLKAAMRSGAIPQPQMTCCTQRRQHQGYWQWEGQNDDTGDPTQ